MTALAYALQLLDVLPALIEAGMDVSRTISAAREAMARMDAENRPPSEAEWDALNREIARLRGELHAG